MVLPQEAADLGWIKLYRSLFASTTWKRATPERKVLLITLMLMARHRVPEQIILEDGTRVSIGVGELFTSYAGVGERCQLPRDRVRAGIEWLKRQGFCARVPTKARGLHLRILRYRDYQTPPARPQARAQGPGASAGDAATATPQVGDAPRRRRGRRGGRRVQERSVGRVEP